MIYIVRVGYSSGTYNANNTIFTFWTSYSIKQQHNNGRNLQVYSSLFH